MSILNRLKNLEKNLLNSGKPAAAKVCSDARDEIIRLKAAAAPKQKTQRDIIAEKLARFM